ncbi:MAG: HPF/RaiA family ribosome-associated protein [Flavobacteriaceae bacterium]|nr:HPF/RaiA family ribosome-associated protein [Flavobacteriaceae bacterium]
MKYNFQFINFSADGKLLDLLKKRTNKLNLFFNKIISVQVYAKLKNSPTSSNKEVEFIISIPGDQFIVKKSSYSFETSINIVSSTIERLLKKHKEKLKLNGV